MEIKWLGHACFLLTAGNGTRIVTDPFNKEVGYPTPNVKADLVVCSHDHWDHSAVDEVMGDPAIINTPGTHHFRDINIIGVPTFHDQEGGAKRGKNIIFVFEADGLRIAHCGDLGHILTPEQVEALGQIDVLLIPTGGTYTVDPSEAAQVVGQLNPKIVIPMHYKTPVMNFPIQGVDAFLQRMGGGKKMDASSLIVTRKNLPEKTQVFVLEYVQ